MRRGMHTGQELFPLEFKPGIPRVRPWKEFLAIGATRIQCFSDNRSIDEIARSLVRSLL